MILKVSSLHIYPIKGLGGIEVSEVQIETRGFRYDRRLMLVDQDGVFLSQRKLPKMATLKTAVVADGITVVEPFSSVYIPFGLEQNPDAAPIPVRIFSSEVIAVHLNEVIDRWFSNYLQSDCRLVGIGSDFRRPVNPQYGLPGDEVGFADGFPMLLTNESSLHDLNLKLPSPITMDRFRPNVVVTGSAAPWIEDNWSRLQIGGVVMRNAKPCGRCSVPSVDQTTGVPTGDEPLRTLATFRQVGNSVNFGINLCPDQLGIIRVGQSVEVLD